MGKASGGIHQTFLDKIEEIDDDFPLSKAWMFVLGPFQYTRISEYGLDKIYTMGAG